MNQKLKVYGCKNIYDVEHTKEAFEEIWKENIRYHLSHCKRYRKLVNAMRHEPFLEPNGTLALPTAYLKKYHLRSMPLKKMAVCATSSGTSGTKSLVGYDWAALHYGTWMILRMAQYHHLFSVHPVNYLMLTYKPSKSNHTIISKTSYYSTYFAPPKHRFYALSMEDGKYQLHEKTVLDTLIRYSKEHTPVRIIGFPMYCYYLLKRMEEQKLTVQLPKDSMVWLGGGWKGYTKDPMERTALYAMIERRLGVPESQIREFFGAAEHPVVYCACKNHHYHIPAYARVIARDVHTLKPLDFGEPGILNFVTPLLKSMPLSSIMTDDIGVVHEGKDCGCGITAPYFEVYGRANMEAIVTCAAKAGELLKKEED